MTQHARPGAAGEVAAAPLERAATLPPRLYTDAETWNLEVERVLRRGWLPVARLDRLAQPGDYVSFDLLGEPLVAVRDQAGALRVLSRVCRHRWMPVVEGAGSRRSFQCPYHLWTYALDGRLLGAPEMQRAEGFDAAACRLPEVRSEVWEGWLFVCFDPEAAPLGPALEPLRRRVAAWRLGDMRVVGEPLEFDSPWNWKLMVENFIESYHHFGIHADTLEPIFPARTTFVDDEEGPFVVLRNPTRAELGPVPSLLPSLAGLSAAQQSELVVCCVFPLHLFALSSDHAVWYQMEPLAVDRFRLRIHLCLPPEVAADPAHAAAIQELRAALEAIHRQDIVACAGVQAGLRSRFAAVGRLSHLEKGLWLFHRYIARSLGGAG